MAEYATREDVQDIVGTAVDNLSKSIDEKIGKAVDDLSEIIGNVAQQMSDAVVDLRRENQEMKDTLNRFMNTVDGFMKRLDEAETEQLARDRQFERLVTWAKKVSEKTGIPLDNL